VDTSLWWVLSPCCPDLAKAQEAQTLILGFHDIPRVGTSLLVLRTQVADSTVAAIPVALTDFCYPPGIAGGSWTSRKVQIQTSSAHPGPRQSTALVALPGWRRGVRSRSLGGMCRHLP
jgi:hypothetical protein